MSCGKHAVRLLSLRECVCACVCVFRTLTRGSGWFRCCHICSDYPVTFRYTAAHVRAECQAVMKCGRGLKTNEEGSRRGAPPSTTVVDAFTLSIRRGSKTPIHFTTKSEDDMDSHPPGGWLRYRISPSPSPEETLEERCKQDC